MLYRDRISKPRVSVPCYWSNILYNRILSIIHLLEPTSDHVFAVVIWLGYRTEG